ncbi:MULTISPECIES: hypothetical protein [unclassified Chryseobacterium]|uniref:hypothetical protein n=1 Tax=unclassified Chryseobacterium TaxID=2593645 RepID=UPI00064896FE|nr:MULTISPECIES: hypothetical protein [unclassified Chryseobacterium]SHF06439.1 hypothetical protein SAMN02787100_1467 [Chryseobacterium sp. OV279]HCA09299.1 hypothetical protein [Chryseobacterium sp.]
MKSKLFYAIMMAAFISCSTESTAVVTPVDAKKSKEITNFEKSIKSLSLPQNLPTEEEKRNQQSLELSDRRKDILIPSALELIKSTGTSDQEIKKITQGDRDKILTWAVKIYNEKNNKTPQKTLND